jgi:hypothetical protein
VLSAYSRSSVDVHGLGAMIASPYIRQELFVAFGCPARRGQPFVRLALGTLIVGMCSLGGFPLGCLVRQAFGRFALVGSVLI